MLPARNVSPLMETSGYRLTLDIASKAHAESAVKVLPDNIFHQQQGLPMNGLNDMKRGY